MLHSVPDTTKSCIQMNSSISGVPYQNFHCFLNLKRVMLSKSYLLVLLVQLSRGEICVANFIPPANGASQANYFLPKSHKLAAFKEKQAYKNSSVSQACKHNWGRIW